MQAFQPPNPTPQTPAAASHLKAFGVGAAVGLVVAAALVLWRTPEPAQVAAPQAIVTHTQKRVKEEAASEAKSFQAKASNLVHETFRPDGTLVTRTRMSSREKAGQESTQSFRRELVATSDVAASFWAPGTAARPLGLGAGLLVSPKGAGVSVTAEAFQLGPVQGKAGLGVINPQAPAPVGVLGVGAEVAPRMNLGVVGVVGVDGAGPWAAPGIILEHRF